MGYYNSQNMKKIFVGGHTKKNHGICFQMNFFAWNYMYYHPTKYSHFLLRGKHLVGTRYYLLVRNI